MISSHPLVLAVLIAAVPVVSAQEPAVAPVSAASGTEDVMHLLVIEGNQVFLDGALLRGAVPTDLDLVGLQFAIEFSGPVIPVVEVDGQAYVLEDDKLVRFEESSRAGQGVYILGELNEDPASMPDSELASVSDQAYLREVAARDEGLYEKLQEERLLEDRVMLLGERVRATPRGPDYVRLRGELRSRLSDLFRMKQHVRREEVDRAQAQLDEMRSVLNDRDSQHDAIVDARLRQICGE